MLNYNRKTHPFKTVYMNFTYFRTILNKNANRKVKIFCQLNKMGDMMRFTKKKCKNYAFNGTIKR